MASMFRQAELLKAVSEWVRLGYVVEVTAEGVKVMPKGAEKSPAELLAQLALHKPKVMNLRGKTPILSIGRKRMTYRRMAEIMLGERQRLKVAQHDLHALRYRGVMDLAFGGATDEEIGSISGHESKAMIRQYAGDARQIMLAKSANKKREA